MRLSLLSRIGGGAGARSPPAPHLPIKGLNMARTQSRLLGWIVGILVVCMAVAVVAKERLTPSATQNQVPHYFTKTSGADRVCLLLKNGYSVDPAETTYSAVVKIRDYNDNDIGVITRAYSLADSGAPRLFCNLQVTPAYDARNAEANLTWYTVATVVDTTDSTTLETVCVDTVRCSQAGFRWDAMRIQYIGAMDTAAWCRTWEDVELTQWLYLVENE